MFDYFIEQKLYIGNLSVLIACLCGSYYLLKGKNAARRFKYFVWFLWFVFFVDISGSYALWNYFDDYKTFPWLEDSVFVRNEWLYNCLKLITYIIISSILISSLETSKLKSRLKFAVVLYFIIGVAEILFSGKVFYAYIIENIFMGTILLLICVGAYFRKLTQSDDVLNFSRDLTFYIAVGYLVWNLCVTPIFIYDSYFNTKNEDFILLYAAILRYSNIFMYGLFSFAFIYCAKGEGNSKKLEGGKYAENK
ncbi:hypothetical protein [Gillisia hiemivivida]|uniref:Uncharacterized protein n=1 Tax=Gillisia hiemivivida TaxID=291190 RepID=A0A5C7A0C8_9FLAO|nr:hypothetical protein [Gillisia hiemivivida]TXD94512.1 hypothetical protein ES724_05740 [Gillisia hiemivivida]